MTKVPEKQNFLKLLFGDKHNLVSFVKWEMFNQKKPIILFGDNEPDDFCLSIFNALKNAGKDVDLVFTPKILDPDYDYNKHKETYFALWCPIPQSSEEWEKFHENKKTNPKGFFGIWELIPKYSMIDWLSSKTSYYLHRDLLGGIYNGFAGPEYPDLEYDGFVGVIKKLNEMFPLKGKSVIEYGPLDGTQTIGLAKHAEKVTTIELRPENAIKTITGLHLSKINNVNLIMTDFHSVRGEYYGRFDLVFAHGVYYHSEFPFLWLENLFSLSDNIFIGGWVANDKKPKTPIVELVHDGKAYRTKIDKEYLDWATAGVGKHGYLFYKEDLIKFFEINGYSCKIMSFDDGTDNDKIYQGGFLRALFQRKN